METLPLSEAFPYLGRTITYNNSDWVSFYLNLRKSQRRWGMVERLIERTGSTAHDQVDMYKAVAQSVILCASKSWVMTS